MIIFFFAHTLGRRTVLKYLQFISTATIDKEKDNCFGQFSKMAKISQNGLLMPKRELSHPTSQVSKPRKSLEDVCAVPSLRLAWGHCCQYFKYKQLPVQNFFLCFI